MFDVPLGVRVEAQSEAVLVEDVTWASARVQAHTKERGPTAVPSGNGVQFIQVIPRAEEGLEADPAGHAIKASDHGTFSLPL
jgi:hypothetical protein